MGWEALIVMISCANGSSSFFGPGMKNAVFLNRFDPMASGFKGLCIWIPG
jgi:hypothetical protein